MGTVHVEMSKWLDTRICNTRFMDGGQLLLMISQETWFSYIAMYIMLAGYYKMGTVDIEMPHSLTHESGCPTHTSDGGLLLLSLSQNNMTISLAVLVTVAAFWYAVLITKSKRKRLRLVLSVCLSVKKSVGAKILT